MLDKTEDEIMKNWKGNCNDPIVSIKCLAYNHENYIEQALDGFLMQETHFPFEIVIHDDASTDNTASIIRDYEKKFPHIICPIYENENQYSKRDGSLRRIINSHLRGKYVALCEGDDFWCSPEKLQKQVAFLENNPKCSMTFTTAEYYDGKSIIRSDYKCSHERDFTVKEIIRGGGLFCATASLCYRSEILQKEYEYQKLKGVGDYRLQIACALNGSVHYFPERMAVYRVDTSNSTSWSNRVLSDKNKQISHWNDEIVWLKKLDEETKGKYSTDVFYRIWFSAFLIYQFASYDKHQLFQIFKKLSIADKLGAALNYGKYHVIKLIRGLLKL